MTACEDAVCVVSTEQAQHAVPVCRLKKERHKIDELQAIGLRGGE